MLQLSVLHYKDLNKKLKVTMKKNYINDVLASSKASLNLAPKIYLIVSDNKKLTANSAKKINNFRRKQD